MLCKNKYIINGISITGMLTSDFHANQIVFVWYVKRLGTNGFKFLTKGSLLVMFSSMGRSLIYNKNSRGPRIEPYGTPQTILLGADVAPLTVHTCSLLSKMRTYLPSSLIIPNCTFILCSKTL